VPSEEEGDVFIEERENEERERGGAGSMKGWNRGEGGLCCCAVRTRGGNKEEQER